MNNIDNERFALSVPWARVAELLSLGVARASPTDPTKPLSKQHNNIHTTKHMKTPSIIAAFVKAKNDRDTNAVVGCFSDDAVVKDEGKKMTGLTAITKWSDKGFKKYEYTIDPTGLAKGDKDTVLTATLTGTFPGSPVSLDFHFTIKDKKIARLTIG